MSVSLAKKYLCLRWYVTVLPSLVIILELSNNNEINFYAKSFWKKKIQ